MADHDSDREGREPEEKGVPFDEAAAWEAIVAGYGEEPPDPPGARPRRPVRDLALPPEPGDDGPEADTGGGENAENAEKRSGKDGDGPAPAGPLGSSVSFAPGVGLGGVGPRDYSLAEPSDDDFDEDDEGHFVPPEPPPLSSVDAVTMSAWFAVIGGPVLLLLAVMFDWEMTWWLATLGIGGFLGGFATLVARMNPDEEDDDPGRGAVV